MARLYLNAKSFKRMEDPIAPKSKKPKYVFYAQAKNISEEFLDWMRTNPRDQKMTTNVAKEILNSLEEKVNFHELNRGIVFSAENVTYDNQAGIVELELENPDLHGNLDGGHTLKAILHSNKDEVNPTKDDRYVVFEVFTGIESTAELAAARNTSVQVDLKSIEELKKSFETIKTVLTPSDPLDPQDPLYFSSRVAYKMNEHIGESPIDVREIVAILNMFNQALYPITNNGHVGETQPIQSYTGKETSLKKFLDLGKSRREEIILKMQPIVKDIFALYEKIEKDFPNKVNKANRRYGSKKYSKFNDNKLVGQSLFAQSDLTYIVPKGIIYPVLASFRALVEIDSLSGTYKWKKHPLDVWEVLGVKIATIVMDEKEDNPEYIGKSTNLWSNLFKEVIIHVTFS